MEFCCQDSLAGMVVAATLCLTLGLSSNGQAHLEVLRTVRCNQHLYQQAVQSYEHWNALKTV